MSGFVAPALRFITMRFIARNITKLLSRVHFWRFLGLLAADVMMFSLTDAANVPSYGLIAGFILLSLTVYMLIHGFISALGFLYGLNIGSVRRKRRLAGSCTGLISFVVALQSIGELSPRDIAVLLPLVILAYLYSYKLMQPV